jgi:hypothetical protein
MDTDEKNAELFQNELSMQLQDRLVLFPDLSYNTLASAAIDEEGTIWACAETDEKKKKRVMSELSRGGSGGTPPKYHLVYKPHVG